MDAIDELYQKLKEIEEGETIALLILDYLTDEDKKALLITILSSFRKEAFKQPKLTKLEKAVYELVQEMGAVTIDDVVENLGDKIDSLKYRTHASDTLNSLVRKGLIGKITYGKRSIYLTPKEAVIQAMKDLDMLPTRCNIKKIADYTNLDIHRVIDVIKKMI